MDGRSALLVLAVGLAATAPAPVHVDLLPHVVMVGGDVRLTCTVAANPHNRLLIYGLSEYAPDSERALDGDHAPIHFPPVYYSHVPCDAGDAYCAVVRDDGKAFLDRTPLHVQGCDGAH